MSLVLALVMCLSLCVPAMAGENPNNSESIFKNEYEMLISLKQEKVMLEGSALVEQPALISDTDNEDMQKYIEALQNFSPEEAILERASLSSEMLHAKGYTDDQIDILKAYDGSPIENNPQLARALGKLWATILMQDYSNSRAAARFSWRWTTQPVITGVFSDIVACAWRGIGNDNREEAMTIDKSLSTFVVEYVTETGDNPQRHTYDIDDKDPQKNAEVKFALTKNGGWAESGYFDVYLKEEVVVNNMGSTTFIFAYGHTNFTVSPSISVSGSGPSLGLSCGFGTDEMYNEWMKVKSNGAIEVSYT